LYNNQAGDSKNKTRQDGEQCRPMMSTTERGHCTRPEARDASSCA